MPTIKRYQEKQVYINKAREAEKRYGIPENTLVGLLAQESGHFDPKVISGERKSYAGAIGISQFMPKTAKEYKIGPLNVDQAIDASAKYLAKSFKNLGNWDDAILSYNAGEGRVREYRAGKPIKLKEHREYVDRVKNQIQTYSGNKPTFAKDVAPYMNTQSNNVSILPETEINTTFAQVEVPQSEIDKLNEIEYQTQQTNTTEITPQEDTFMQNLLAEISKGVEYVKPIQKEIMQSGGTIYVDSTNDPRYKAYQDSLTVYNANKYGRDYYNKNIKPFIKTGNLENLNDKWYYGVNGKIIDEGDDAELRLEKRNKKTYKFVNSPKSEGEKFFGVQDAWYPKQKVLVEKQKYTEETPQVEGLKAISPQGITSQNNSIETQLPNITPQAQKPKSFDIEYSAQRMNGGTGYYDQNNVQGVDIETALRAKKQADIQNQYWQEKYKNLENPKAQERLKQLRDSVKITPNYQEGGQIIKDDLGQWKFPGEVTEISSPNITMKNVPYSVLGVADTGEIKMMKPNQDYFFEGAKSVTEYPQLTENEKAFLKEFN